MTTSAQRFESNRHASAAAMFAVRRVVADARDMTDDDARKMFKREATRSRARFDRTSDDTVRTFEAVFMHSMKARAEAMS